MEIFLSIPNSDTTVKAKSGITLHTQFGAVRVGDFAATEPAIKGRAFMEVFYQHKHLTPMGPTGPVDTITIFTNSN